MLRIYMDKEGGVSVDDCAEISKKIDDLIDIKVPIPFRYSLEVSSPGLDRPLRTEKDFQRFCGHRARIRTREPLEGRRNFTGRIARCVDGIVDLEDERGAIQRVAVTAIEKARLIVEI